MERRTMKRLLARQDTPQRRDSLTRFRHPDSRLFDSQRFLLSAVAARVALYLVALFHVVILTWTDIDTSSPCKAHARFQD